MNLPCRKGLCLSISFLCMWQGGKRSDGRTPNEIRPINSSCGLLPRAHGSALFTRGETQVGGDFSLSPNLCFDVSWYCLYMLMQLWSLDPPNKEKCWCHTYPYQAPTLLGYFVMCLKRIPIFLFVLKLLFWILLDTLQ